MPPKLNREKVESALPLAVRGYLHDLFKVWGIHTHERWPDHPQAHQFLTLLAVQNLRDRKLRQATSRTSALRSACEELGLSYEATKSCLIRARNRYLDANARVVANCHQMDDLAV